MKSKKKATYDQALSLTKFRLDSLEKQFKEESAKFITMTNHGDGINNLFMLDTINSLRFIYAKIAAYRDVLRSLEGKI